MQFFKVPLLIILLIITLTGCASKKETYYQPIVNIGYYHTACGGPDNYGATHVNDKLTYFIKVHTTENHSIDSIRIEYAIAPKSKLEHTSNVVTLIGDNYKKEISINFIEKGERKIDENGHLYYTKKIPLMQTLIGYKDPYRSHIFFSEYEERARYFFEIEKPDFSAQRLILKLPKLILDGEELILEDIIIEKVTDRYMLFTC